MTLKRKRALDIQKKEWKISYRNAPGSKKSYILDMKINSMTFWKADKGEIESNILNRIENRG